MYDTISSNCPSATICHTATKLHVILAGRSSFYNITPTSSSDILKQCNKRGGINFGDQTADVSTVKWWVVHFSSGNSDTKEKPCSGWPFRFLTALHVSSSWSLAKASVPFFRYWKATLSSLQSLLFSNLNSLNSLCLSTQKRCSISWIIFFFGPPLDAFQQIQSSLVVRTLHSNIILQVKSHQHIEEGQDHFLWPAGHNSFDAAQDMVGFLGCSEYFPGSKVKPTRL